MRQHLIHLLIPILICGCAERSEASFTSSPQALANMKPQKAANPSVSLEEPAPTSPRSIAYDASMSLGTGNIPKAIQGIQALAQDSGGHLVRSDSASILIKVPASRFEYVMEGLRSMGEVLAESIRAEDVTDSLMDLNLRIDNAEKTRQRLLKILDGAQNVEDALKVEKELSRLTLEIELMKGQLKSLSGRVEMSLITVTLVTKMVREPQLAKSPFPWVERLGEEISANHTGSLELESEFMNDIQVRLPETCLLYGREDKELRAMNSNGVHLMIRQHDNPGEGSGSFWDELVRQSVTRRHFLKSAQANKVPTTQHGNLLCTRGLCTLGQIEFGYLVGVVTTRHHVYTVEIWGQSESFEASLAELTMALESLKVS